jgi:deoxyribodipyrimidine photolyase-like uncharacterized protein
VTVLPPRGFVTAPRDFVAWADERRAALRMEDFYRHARRRHGVLMDGAEPAGGRWNLDADNRQPPPRDTGRLDVEPAPSIVEDEIDAGVRADLDRWEAEGIAFVGRDGPRAFPAWFHRSFVDGYEWAMTANVVGMSQYADLGRMTTKPYAAGGAYINRMSDYCRGCRYDPRIRLGVNACPFTAGYWAFLDRTRGRLAGNARLAQALRQLDRLDDVGMVREQELARGSRAP